MNDQSTQYTDIKREPRRLGEPVIMALTVNCRIESGRFSINSSDRKLIFDIYNSLDCEKIVTPYVMPQKSCATAEGMIMRIASPNPIISPVDSIVVEFANNRDADMTTGELYGLC